MIRAASSTTSLLLDYFHARDQKIDCDRVHWISQVDSFRSFTSSTSSLQNFDRHKRYIRYIRYKITDYYLFLLNCLIGNYSCLITLDMRSQIIISSRLIILSLFLLYCNVWQGDEFLKTYVQQRRQRNHFQKKIESYRLKRKKCKCTKISILRVYGEKGSQRDERERDMLSLIIWLSSFQLSFEEN